MANTPEDSAVEAALAHKAISEVLYGYARGIRGGNVSACLDLFTQDAVFDIRDAAPAEPGGYRRRQLLHGREEIEAYLRKGAVASVKVFPLIHNVMIDVQGSEASSNSVMTAWVLPAGQQVLGEYEDRYRFQNGWRFVSRIYTIFGSVGAAPASADSAARSSRHG
jgi:hypothetical protein